MMVIRIQQKLLWAKAQACFSEETGGWEFGIEQHCSQQHLPSVQQQQQQQQNPKSQLYCAMKLSVITVSLRCCLARLNHETEHLHNRCLLTIKRAADMKHAAAAKQQIHKAMKGHSQEPLTGFSVSLLHLSWPAVLLWLEQSAASIAHLLC